MAGRLHGTLVWVVAIVVALGAPAVVVCAEVVSCQEMAEVHAPCHRAAAVEVTSASLHDCCPDAARAASEASSPGMARRASVWQPAAVQVVSATASWVPTDHRPTSRAGPPSSLFLTLSTLLI